MAGAAYLQACLNGARSPREHPALPASPEALAADARACVAAGAAAVHLHPRDGNGRESLDARVVDAVVARVRRACAAPVGVATGAWVEPDPQRRAAHVARWREPDFASVNLSEEGAVEVMRALAGAGIGIEAGVWSARDAELLAASGLAGTVTRVLVEIVDGPAATAVERMRAIEDVLVAGSVRAPRLVHGENDACWPVLRHARATGRATRVGLEDTLRMPDGTPAPGNEALVRGAGDVTSAARGSVSPMPRSG